ncbi:phosphotransferase [Ruania halotolerans]|uniref:phosphotransferase n=1 Tax=Ruania halotolerans TaxID=2897773 RepID=UPI001E359E08|nr:phosphotransferase [Ruania halotolerans]UFU05784.1 phosphotransferase [Ruania halotolerans]
MTTLVPEELTLLTGSDAGDLVRAAIGVDEALAGLVVEVDAVHHRPGLGVSAVYAVDYRVAGRPVREHLVASTAAVPDAPSVAVLDNGVHRVRVWRRADDPALPGLRAALDPRVVAGWLRPSLTAHGGRSSASDPTPIGVELLGYRPTRRAVVRVMGPGGPVAYLKILPPARTSRLVRRHQVLEQTGVPAPRVVGEPVPGVVVLSVMTGTALTNAIAGARSHPEDLPAAEELVAWLDALPDAVRALPRRQSWVDRIDFHASAARAAQPASMAGITAIERGVADLLSELPAPAQVPTHGDFYEANVFTAAGKVHGAIDLDSLGPGAREDDLATMLGHLSVLPALAPERYHHVDEITDDWFAVFSERVDPAALAARVAAVVLSLVAGTAADQGRARLAVADRWLTRARNERAGRKP